MAAELTIIVKDSEKTLKRKDIIYDPFTMCSDDPLIMRYVNETLKNFDGEPTDVQIKVSMTL